MPRLSKDSAPNVQDAGPAVDRSGDLDDTTVSFVTIRQGHSLAPLLRGLPGDSCQCPHWGYLLAGKITVSYADHEETYQAGDAFYMTPGHVPAAEAGTEFIQFSPKEQLAETMAAMQGQRAAGDAGRIARPGPARRRARSGRMGPAERPGRRNKSGRVGVGVYPCIHAEVRMSPLDHEHPVSPERVAAARAGVPPAGEAGRLAGLLGMLADPVRSRILFALSAAGELCVGDLALALEATEDQVSYALKMLRLAGIVSFRKDGRMVFYRLSDGFPHPLLEHCLRQLLSIASPEGHDAGD